MLTGIPPSVWAAEGDRTIATALQMLEQARQRDDDDRQTSG